MYTYNKNHKKRVNSLIFLRNKYKKFHYNKFNQSHICSKNLLFLYFGKEYKKYLSSFLFLNFNNKNIFLNKENINNNVKVISNYYFFYIFKSSHSFLFLNYHSLPFFNIFSKYFSGYYRNRGRYFEKFDTSKSKFPKINNLNSKYCHSLVNKYITYDLNKKFVFINYLYDPFCFMLKSKKFILTIEHLPYGAKKLFTSKSRQRKKLNDGEEDVNLDVGQKNYIIRNNKVKWYLLQRTYFNNNSPFYYIIFMGLSCCRRYILGFLDVKQKKRKKLFSFWNNLKKVKKKLIFSLFKKIKSLKDFKFIISFCLRYRFLKNRKLRFKKRMNICFSKVFIKNLFFYKKIKPFESYNNKSFDFSVKKISDFIFIIYYLFSFIVRFKTKKFRVPKLDFLYFVESFKDYLFFFEKSLNFFFSNKIFASNSFFITLRFKFYSLLFFFFKFHFFLNKLVNLYKTYNFNLLDKTEKIIPYRAKIESVRYKICSIFNFNFFDYDRIVKRSGQILYLLFIKTFYCFFILLNLGIHKKRFLNLQFLFFSFIRFYYDSYFFSKRFLKRFFSIFSYRNNFSFKLFYSKYFFIPHIHIYQRYDRFSRVLKKMYYIRKDKRISYIKRKNKTKYHKVLLDSVMKKKNLKGCKYVLKHFKVIKVRNNQFLFKLNKLCLKPLVMNFVSSNNINYQKVSKLFFLKKFMLLKILYFYKFIKLNFVNEHKFRYNLNFMNFFIYVFNFITSLTKDDKIKISKNSLFSLILFFIFKKLNKSIILNESNFALNRIVMFKNKFYIVKNI